MKVCLLTNELYPARYGGLGRMMWNFCKQNKDAGFPADLHFLLIDVEPKEEAMLRAHYDGLATLHVCPDLADIGEHLGYALATDTAYHPDYGKNYRRAYLFHTGLLAAEAASGGPFDVVEYPDYGGWGHAIQAARVAGIAHQGTVLSCRLHSSQGLITRAEPFWHQPSVWFSAMFDVERECIEAADLIVGHVPSIVEENAMHYSFGEDWRAKVLTEFPPIVFDGDPQGVSQLGEQPDFVFSSRLQQFKRPDVFVRGAVAFFENNPDYRGVARVLSYGWDDAYIQYIRSLIPMELVRKVIFQLEYTPEERDQILAKSIVVVPSNYESLCLFAFEAGHMGAPVVLAADCAAFGQSDRWVDGENCLLFDGGFIDLAQVLERAVTWRPSRPVDCTPDLPYWTDADRIAAMKSAKVADGTETGFETLRYGVSNANDLNKLLLDRAVRGTTERKINLFLPARLAKTSDTGPSIVTHRISGTSLSPTQIAHVVEELAGSHVLILHADYHVTDSFLETARSAIAHTPDLALFTTHLRVTTATGDQTVGVVMSTGGAPGMAIVDNSVAPRAAVISKAALREIGLDPMAGDFWFDVFCRRLALSGAKICVAPSAMIETVADSATVTNGRKLTGSIADHAGFQWGSTARLLGLPFHGPNRAIRIRSSQALGLTQIRQARPVFPDPDSTNIELAGARPEHGGLLVHPLSDVGATIADLRQITLREANGIRVKTFNASKQNKGLEMCVIASPGLLSQEDLATLAAGTPPPGVVMSPWMLMAPGAQCEGEFAVRIPQHARLYVASRLPKGVQDQSFGWAILKEIEFIEADLGF